MEYFIRRTEKLCALSCFFVFFFHFASAQLNAEFTVDEIEGCAPLIAQFIDQSTGGNIVSWEWSLGDETGGCSTGPSSTDINPGRIFTASGSYCICLTVTDINGATDTECKSDYISVYGSPVADFTAPVSEGCVPLTVDFSDITIPGTGNLVSWQWDLNNGNCPSANTQNISCTYTIPGTYDISLIVTDANGCSHFIQKDNFITVHDNPNSDFVADVTSSCQSTLSVNFSPVETNIANWAFDWDFGDGNSSTAATPNHTFNTMGSFSVSLIVTDTITGCTDSTAYNSIIQVGNPVSFSYTPDEGCPDLTVSFLDETIGNASNWQWDFGDGLGTSTQQHPSYTYTSPGCYFVTLSAAGDNCSGTTTASTCIEVFDLPQATYTGANLMGCILPHTSTFSGSSSSSITTWEWDFGDGGTATGQNVSHDFTQYGTYSISLTVTSTDGCERVFSTDTVSIMPFNVSATADSLGGCAPLTFGLSASANSPFTLTDASWDFGNMTIGTGINTTITYPDTGTYVVELIGTNNFGCMDTTEIVAEVGMPHIIDFIATPTDVCAEEPVQFNNITTADIDQWIWEFGDGSTSALANPTHIYQDTGLFTICLTVYQNSCPTSICKEDYIHILPPIARFSHDQNCTDPYTVSFTDNSIGADTHFWDFGVTGTLADTSTLANPTFTFPDRGIYTVSLTVNNFQTGCSFDLVRTVEIRDAYAEFTVAPDTGCALLTVVPEDLSIDAVDYEWLAPGGVLSPNATSPTAVIEYANAGVYTDIGLIVADIYGCRDTLMLPDSILVSDVFPGFTSNISAGCIPLTISFTDTSSAFGSDIVSWLWDFGDGNTSTSQNPSHDFTSKGQKDITLTVTNALGCTQSLTMPEYIDPTYPDVSFVADTLACTGQTVSFTSTSLVSDPATYLWDFGDSNTSTDQNPTHNYANEDIYDICLTVTDRNGCDSTLCKPNYIRVGDPVSNFEADNTYASCPPLSVNFTDLSINAAEWEWDFGDNSAAIFTQNASHIYTEPGTYDVCLYIKTATGCPDTLCRPQYIQIDGPSASFSFAPDEGCVPLEVTMIATGTEVVKYTWDSGCGDVQVHNNAAPSDTAIFVYDQPGICYPILVVEDIQGCQRTYVSPDPITTDNLEVDFTTSDTVLCDNGVVTYQSNVNSNVGALQYEWQFPGGTPATSSFPNTSVTYTTPGSYTATLVVTNGRCRDSITKTSSITIADTPIPDFAFSPSTGCEPQSINFSDASSVMLGNIEQWFWDFGTGDTAIVRNPSYTFEQAGTYTVSLTVWSSWGCENTSSQDITILALPTADAGLDQQLCIGETVSLQASGSGTYQWSPATGLSCTTCANPEASPTLSTDYILTVTGANGCTDRDTVNVDVIPFPVPSLNLTGPNTVCAGDFVQLNASSNNAGVIFYWDESREGLTCYENCFNPLAYPEVTTTYVVTAVGQGGCSRMDSITVEVINNTAELAGIDRTICRGESVTLSIQGGFNPSWSPFDGLSCINCPTPEASPEETTTYMVEVTTADGCLATDSVQITVMDIDDIDAGADQTICLGDAVELNADGKGVISWSPASSLSATDILNPTATPATTTTYTFLVTNDLCELEDNVTINVRERAEISATGDVICLGDTTELMASGVADSYTWTSPNDPMPINGPRATVYPEETTTYTVIGSLGNCIPDTTEVEVFVNPLPEIEVQETVSYFLGADPVQLEAVASGGSGGGYSYSWSPPDGLSCVTCPDPLAMPDTMMIYDIAVMDSEGCRTVEQVRLLLKEECEEELIIVPNAFTPNGDGLNDLLFVRGSVLSTVNLFRIYDRWGAMVFETENIREGWDGTFKGQALNPGVFVYYVEAPCPLDGSRILKKGNITLLR